MTPGEQTREYYREQGRQQEQARIIALLLDQERQYSDFINQRSNRKNIGVFHAIERTYQAAVALIKGETK
jgi:hypothetical protein